MPDTGAVQFGVLEVLAAFAFAAWLGMRLERLFDRLSYRRTLRRAR